MKTEIINNGTTEFPFYTIMVNSEEYCSTGDIKKAENLVKLLSIGFVMPRSLTAENGAKALLIGEFNETYEDTDEEGNEYSIKIPVRWTTIKDIYKKIIDRYGA